MKEDDVGLLVHIGLRERKVLSYFKTSDELLTKDLSTLFGIKDRTSRDLIKKWMGIGFMERRGKSDRNSFYVLSDKF